MATLYDFTLGGQSVANGLTAHAGGTQAAALPLTSAINVLATVATAGDSVMAPQTANGSIFILDNTAGAASCQVYGQLNDTINGVASATGVAVPNGKRALFYCTQPAVAAVGSTPAVIGKWGMILTA